MDDVLKKINEKLHEGKCPQAGCLGECAIIDNMSGNHWWAAIYIWDTEFNDSTAVAQWFYECGAEDVVIKHVLYDSCNGDKDGCCIDDAKAWHVDFFMPDKATAS